MSSLNSGAGEESRTLDLNLGKVALYQLSYSRLGVLLSTLCGAGEESRTLDLNLGKVALYQLSYSRTECFATDFTTTAAPGNWSGRRVSNSRPQPWQGCALPTELLPHSGNKDYRRNCFNFQDKLPLPTSLQTGAGEESRTLDLNLGKVALYQLSYSRFVSCFALRLLRCRRNRQAL